MAHELIRCFVVGCPRSGTTVLQASLGAHPGLLTFPESDFYAYIRPVRFRPRTIKDHIERRYTVHAELRPRLKRFLNDLNIAPELSRFPSSRFGRSRWSTAFVRLLDEVTIRSGKQGWVEKTPLHFREVSFIRKHVERSRFIHIERDALDAIASMFDVSNRHPEQWNGGWRVDRCVDQWIEAWDEARRWERSADYLVLSFEGFVRNPESELQRVCSFLELNFLPEMLEPDRRPREIVRGEEAWKRASLGQIRPPTSKFREVFSEDEQGYIRTRLQLKGIPDALMGSF